MEESDASAPPTFFFPLWARIAFACFMFAVSGLDMWDKFFRFDWVFFLCMGLYQLIQVPQQKCETRKDYFRKPRTIISVTLLIAIITAALHTLLYISTKHRF